MTDDIKTPTAGGKKKDPTRKLALWVAALGVLAIVVLGMTPAPVHKPAMGVMPGASDPYDPSRRVPATYWSSEKDFRIFQRACSYLRYERKVAEWDSFDRSLDKRCLTVGM